MAKKKYVQEQMGTQTIVSSNNGNQFPGISKRDLASLQELTSILNAIPEHEQTEAVRTDLACYKLVRDTFLTGIKNLSHHTIKLDRNQMSPEEKKIFHEVLILALEYHLNKHIDSRNPYTKKELRERFNVPDESYKRYDAMIDLLENNWNFGDSLRKGFKQKEMIPDGSPAKGLEFALQGAKLFAQRDVNAISIRIPQVTKGHQSDLHNILKQ